MRFLSAADIAQAVPMSAAIDAVAQAFGMLARGEADIPLRTAITTPAQAATTFFMPGRLGGETPALGIKTVSVFPHNVYRAEPTIYALVTLFDPASGRPIAVLDGTYLTALRTGAASGVATRLLAREDVRTLVVFGAGAQALPQLQAVLAVRPSINNVWIVNRTRDRATLLAARLRGEGFRGDIRIATDPTMPLAEADVVCTATSSPNPLFAADLIRPGTHINAVGAYRPDMAELPPDLVARSRVVVDQRHAAWSEAGDLIQARAAGLIDEQHVIAELGDLVNGTVQARTTADEITLFKSVGNAVQDLAVASLALAQATTLGLGVEVTI
ncbi:MAG TPA: ornithine cyclodeaminase [Chloroflexus aurantiacus]|jgi:ornithine cyclodeaminase|uniref:Ornithine cyclodeaminase n=1 Tax=Chloroflexus aurantiacus (strain ATCC 29366 / DSM 635 / J-10-fl) TaxID=324602 RepID=A9WF66_CHLAA|nr:MULTISPECIES: ornithine cyclodeaminase [Chloroflexus]ABY36050.1 Ornithine cyclodeaminase [Chloroflexus aurantiacus J-10-fl]RMG49341.1 MAG: ornithine cyclodeaminase [Chloroflexota bacterium]GIV91421.1 MAG: ornithine cyclodeaminase [Chloroflexus sp.]HBW67300.1 ornithine cyclodeaminase [Chloroflexus aurantiacus]